MNDKNTILKESVVKSIFSSALKVHAFSLTVLSTIKNDLQSSHTENALERGIVSTFDYLVHEIEGEWAEYTSELCKVLYECQKHMADNLKFREFCIRASAGTGVKNIYELLTLPLTRIKEYSELFESSGLCLPRTKWNEMGMDIHLIFQESSKTIENAEKLINILLFTTDLPPAVLLK